MSGSHPPISLHVRLYPPAQRRTPACAPAGPQPLLQSCQGSGGSTLRIGGEASVVVPSTPSPRHRPPALRSLGEGRRRRDGATGTTGTGLLLVHNGAQHHAGRMIGEGQLPASRCAPLRTFRAGQESARLLTARTPARPDFPFSRLISRLDCAQLRTGSAVRMGPAVAWRVHNGRAVGTSKKRLRRERQALKCAPSTHHQANREGPSAAFQRARLRTSDRRQKEVGCLDAQRCAGSGPTRKASRCRSCAPEARRSACNRRPSTCSVTARSAAKRKGCRVMRVDGKIKGMYELCRYLQGIPALAALTWGQKVIQTSDGKIKGTKVRFL